MHLERDWVRELDKQMPRVTCRDLDPACRVSAQGEISRVQSEHIHGVLSQGEKRVPIRWGEENVPIPGGEENHYPWGK